MTNGYPGRPQRVVNALSVDVEEWFHVSLFRQRISPKEWPSLRSTVRSNIAVTLELLDEVGVRGTFYVLGWVAERYPDLVAEIRDSGHEIGSHGYAHAIAYEQSRDDFAADVELSLRVLNQITGEYIVNYRAPSYSITEKNLWALETLSSLGIKYDSSIFPIKHDIYGIPSAPRFPFQVGTDGRRVVEFPLSTVRLLGNNVPIAGGAYLRLYPLWFVRAAISSLNRRGVPVVLYFHPWELDEDQPKQKVSLATRLRHYGNIDIMAWKLRKILSDFQFAPVGEVLNRCAPALRWPG